MRISDLIARFINEELIEADGIAEIQRSALADKFNCVPSQINYVISTRFSPEHGYVVESRRGGGGYIRIRRVRMDPERLVMHTINSIGDEIDCQTAAALISNILSVEAISKNTAQLLLAAISDNALRPIQRAGRDVVRASILKQMLVKVI